MEEKKKAVIIKKVKKGHGGGHHGGSWKVAYADFVTAMMAFFLLMWLLAMVAPEKKAVMALYFKDFSLFEKGGKSFMAEGGLKPLLNQKEDPNTGQDEASKESSGDAAGKSNLLSQVEQKIIGLADGLKNNILVDTSEEGVRIQIVDRKESPIFPAGSPQFTEEGKRVVRSVAASMRGLPNDIVVEGHTDASGTKNDQVTNWELSAMRACSAKKELEASGIEAGRVIKVAGFAHTVPLIREDPEDPRNRRVSIVFLYKKKQKAKSPYDWVWKPPPSKK